MSEIAYGKAWKYERDSGIRRGRAAGRGPSGAGRPWRRRIRHPLAAFRRTRRERPQPREVGEIFTGGNDVAMDESSRKAEAYGA